MLYAVGDRVLVRDDLYLGTKYGMRNQDGSIDEQSISFTIAHSQLDFRGETVTIEECINDDEGDFYKISDTNSDAWADDMFVGKVEETYELDEPVEPPDLEGLFGDCGEV